MSLINKEKLIEAIEVIAPYNWTSSEWENAECQMYDAIMEIIESAAPVDEWVRIKPDGGFYKMPNFWTLVNVVATNGVHDLASCHEGIDGKIHWCSIHHLEEIEVKAWKPLSYKDDEDESNH